MKSFNQCGAFAAIFFLGFMLNGCAVTGERDTTGVIGGKLGGVEGILPLDNSSLGTKIPTTKNATNIPLEK